MSAQPDPASRSQGLEIPEFIYCANEIFCNLTFRVRSVDMQQIPPLAQGYGLVDGVGYGDAELVRAGLMALLRNGKTVVIERSSPQLVSLIAKVCLDVPSIRVVEVVDRVPFEVRLEADPLSSRTYAQSTIFLMTEDFILRRFFHQSVQRQNALFPGQRSADVQRVRFVGLGPTPSMLTESVKDLLRESTHVVMFDRTLANVIQNYAFPAHKYVLPFAYEDFAPNLMSLNLMLASLHACNVLDVTVLIEGNPEIYDYSEGLSTVGRSFSHEVSTPLVVLGCRWLERSYGVRFVAPSYVLTSGFNVRQGVTTAELTMELDAYVETDLTFMVMEMFCGDIPLVLSRIARATRAKSVIVLTNMFSPEQRVYYLAPGQAGMTSFVERIKGRFTTLVVVDYERLSRTPDGVCRLVEACGVERAGDPPC